MFESLKYLYHQLIYLSTNIHTTYYFVNIIGLLLLILVASKCTYLS